MGLFKSIGKALTKGVNTVGAVTTKATSIINNVVKPIASVIPGGEMITKQLDNTANMANAYTKFGSRPSPSDDIVTVDVGGRDVEMSTANAIDAVRNGSAKPSTKKDGGITGNEYIDAALGGAMVGLGSHVAGTKPAQTSGSILAKAFTKEWLKQNWYIAAGVVVGLGLAVWAIFFRGKKRKRW